MALTDAVAQQIMGEVHQLTTQLDRQATRFEEADRSLRSTMASMRSTADVEMRRAGDKAISELSGQVSEIAKQIAGDAAAGERRKGFAIAITAAVIGSVIVFGLGVGAGMGINKLQVVAAQNEAQARIQEAEKDIAWLKTDEGKAAKNLAAMGSARRLNECDGQGWKAEKRGTIPNRTTICFPYVDQKEKAQYGWRID